MRSISVPRNIASFLTSFKVKRCEDQQLNTRSEVSNSGDTEEQLLDAFCCQVASYSLGEAPGQGPSETSHSGAMGIPCSSCTFQADLYATTAA